MVSDLDMIFYRLYNSKVKIALLKERLFINLALKPTVVRFNQ